MYIYTRPYILSNTIVCVCLGSLRGLNERQPAVPRTYAIFDIIIVRYRPLFTNYTLVMLLIYLSKYFMFSDIFSLRVSHERSVGNITNMCIISKGNT